MTQRRWILWLALLAIVVGLRWWDPLARSPAQEIAQPVLKTRPVADRGPTAPAARATSTPAWPEMPTAWPLRAPTVAAQSDLFALRTPPARPPEPEPEPVPEPPPPPVAEPTPVAVAVEVLPPPLQVIGTWTQGAVTSVFFSGPNGTLKAKPGEVLLGEYRVEAIRAHEIALLHLPTQKSMTLAVPLGAIGSIPSAAVSDRHVPNPR